MAAIEINNDGKLIKKGINDMTKKELELVPFLDVNNKEQYVFDFDSLVILPNKRIHDSDYRCMSFIACKKDEPICQLSGGSDVIHIEGVGGYGFDWLNRFKTVPTSISPIGWSIDCLKKSGLLRLFTHGNLIADASAFSSFEIYSNPQ